MVVNCVKVWQGRQVQLERIPQSLEVVFSKADLVSQCIVLSDVEVSLVCKTVETEQKLAVFHIRHNVLLQAFRNTPAPR